MKKLFYMTETGVNELHLELQQLLLRRPSSAERVRSAREFGDLSENAEYTSARQDHENLESRISIIEEILQNVKLIIKPKSHIKVVLGSKVTLEAGSLTLKFQVVGTFEADPLNGKISDESPIGQMLLDQKKGDKVEIKKPAGSAIYTIVSID